MPLSGASSFSAGRAGILPQPLGRLQKVLVIGAGVSGLQTARQLLKLGVQVLLLEANSEIGGVWCSNYVGYGLQVPWKLYEFAEFPWPDHPANDYPTGQEVHDYVLAYAQHFDLLRHVRLNSKLLRLRWDEESRTWGAVYMDTTTSKFYKLSADYVVVCTGIYSNPYIPSYPGAGDFVGTQLHAKDFTDYLVTRGRRVLIVGAGKTALDCMSGLVSANTAASVTMLYRKSHWPVPRSLLGVSIRRLLFNRTMANMLPPYYTAGKLERASAVVTKPLRRLFWKGLECLIARQFPAATKNQPAVPLPGDLFHGGQILDDRVDLQLEADGCRMLRGEVNRFVRNGVILQDNSFLPADVVLYCTGYEKTYDYFDGEMRSRLGLQKDGLYLYRNCLPPGVPQLAFVGSEVSTYNNILSSGLQALWLAHVLTGRVALPPPHAMHEDVRAQQRWRREVMPPQRTRGAVVMLYMSQFHDQLMADMGHSPRRKGANVVAECFGVYSAADYAPVVEGCDGPLLAAMAEQCRAAEAFAAHGARSCAREQEQASQQRQQEQWQQQQREQEQAEAAAMYASWQGGEGVQSPPSAASSRRHLLRQPSAAAAAAAAATRDAELLSPSRRGGGTRGNTPPRPVTTPTFGGPAIRPARASSARVRNVNSPAASPLYDPPHPSTVGGAATRGPVRSGGSHSAYAYPCLPSGHPNMHHHHPYAFTPSSSSGRGSFAHSRPPLLGLSPTSPYGNPHPDSASGRVSVGTSDMGTSGPSFADSASIRTRTSPWGASRGGGGGGSVIFGGGGGGGGGAGTLPLGAGGDGGSSGYGSATSSCAQSCGGVPPGAAAAAALMSLPEAPRQQQSPQPVPLAAAVTPGQTWSGAGGAAAPRRQQSHNAQQAYLQHQHQHQQHAQCAEVRVSGGGAGDSLPTSPPEAWRAAPRLAPPPRAAAGAPDPLRPPLPGGVLCSQIAPRGQAHGVAMRNCDDVMLARIAAAGASTGSSSLGAGGAAPFGKVPTSAGTATAAGVRSGPAPPSTASSAGAAMFPAVVAFAAAAAAAATASAMAAAAGAPAPWMQQLQQQQPQQQHPNQRHEPAAWPSALLEAAAHEPYRAAGSAGSEAALASIPEASHAAGLLSRAGHGCAGSAPAAAPASAAAFAAPASAAPYLAQAQCSPLLPEKLRRAAATAAGDAATGGSAGAVDSASGSAPAPAVAQGPAETQAQQSGAYAAGVVEGDEDTEGSAVDTAEGGPAAGGTIAPATPQQAAASQRLPGSGDNAVHQQPQRQHHQPQLRQQQDLQQQQQQQDLQQQQPGSPHAAAAATPTAAGAAGGGGEPATAYSPAPSTAASSHSEAPSPHSFEPPSTASARLPRGPASASAPQTSHYSPADTSLLTSSLPPLAAPPPGSSARGRDRRGSRHALECVPGPDVATVASLSMLPLPPVLEREQPPQLQQQPRSRRGTPRRRRSTLAALPADLAAAAPPASAAPPMPPFTVSVGRVPLRPFGAMGPFPTANNNGNGSGVSSAGSSSMLHDRRRLSSSSLGGLMVLGPGPAAINSAGTPSYSPKRLAPAGWHGGGAGGSSVALPPSQHRWRRSAGRFSLDWGCLPPSTAAAAAAYLAALASGNAGGVSRAATVAGGALEVTGKAAGAGDATAAAEQAGQAPGAS